MEAPVTKERKYPNTKRGYPLDEVMSALQKAIRRAQVKMALYWAAELYESGFGPTLWSRLLVISAEDCWGMVTRHVEALRQETLALEAADKHINGKKKDYQKTLVFVLKATYLLAVAPKCRDADNFYNLVYKTNSIPEEDLRADLEAARDSNPVVPPEAIDKHTVRGKEQLKETGISNDEDTKQFIERETKALRPVSRG
jgi:hypothetical protein